MKIHTATQINRLNTTILCAIIFLAFAVTIRAGDPYTDSWFLTYAGQYARSYTNAVAQSSGNAVTTWNNGTQNQSSPAYCGVQEIYSSSNWVYIRTTGLASHTMGAWQSGFPNLPINQKVLFRFPRTNGVSATKTLTALGAIGYFVDGVAMFDSRDGYVWTGSAESGSGNGYWNRDAYVNESATFDPAYAHQEQTGTYHYHANPIALRYQLGDHVTYNSTARTYSESTNTATQHSPILGWVRDGYPIYGPYGYSDATNANSGIRRMISGYVLRNGQNGTDNLTNTLRANLPAWAQRLYGTNTAGPSNTSTYPIGRYMEDKAYLGDLTNSATGQKYVQGVDFDLDEYNGRWCVTPEFPNGTYAYFVSISTNGAPIFPYNIGRAFRGDAVGGSVSSISETVVTNFLAGTNLATTLDAPTTKNGSVTLTWSALEGGSYQVEASTNLTSWTVLQSGVSPNQNLGGYTNVTSLDKRFYRVARTSVATFDSAGTTTFSTSAVAPGGSASRGTTVTVTITLPSTPPWPPADAPITSVTLAGSISGTGITDSTQGQVVATFTIPADASTGAQNIVVVFTSGPTYTLTGGFTVN